MQELKLQLPELKNNTLIVRTGDLPAPFNVKPLNLSGTEDALVQYAIARKKLIDEAVDDSYVILRQDLLSEKPVTVELVYNAQHEDTVTVKGAMELDKMYLSFGINRGTKYDIRSLTQKLKESRPFFESPVVYDAVLAKLKSFTAKTETEFTQTNDFKGNIAYQKIEKCKTNLEFNFELKLPIYRGLGKNSFDVEIEFEPKDGSIVAWLVSIQAKELELSIPVKKYEYILNYFKTNHELPIIEQ
jgi:hypothetical protein